jgi:peptidoglycan-N-acetylglucosamine deacetylase
MREQLKPAADLSLDLDNMWSYMKTHGNPDWQTHPSYLDILVPRVLEHLDKHDLKITFFIVGQDAALEKNHAALRQIPGAGHEVGNHSFHHEPWLHLYTGEEIEREFAASEAAIHAATGVHTRGFRGPGFSLSRAVLKTLKQRGYLFDASTLPTFIGPLARAYYFFHSSLSDSEREKRRALFGGFKDGMRPLKPYFWDLEEGPLLEIPVTTMPLTRAPFHVSYVMYLACYSPALALFYFRTALELCRLTGVQPSLLLHPLDFLSGSDAEPLRFFPAMQMDAKDKLKLIDRILETYKRYFTVVPMGERAERLAGTGGLPRIAPDFPRDGVARETAGAALSTRP